MIRMMTWLIFREVASFLEDLCDVDLISLEKECTHSLSVCISFVYHYDIKQYVKCNQRATEEIERLQRLISHVHLVFLFMYERIFETAIELWALNSRVRIEVWGPMERKVIQSKRGYDDQDKLRRALRRGAGWQKTVTVSVSPTGKVSSGASKPTTLPNTRHWSKLCNGPLSTLLISRCVSMVIPNRSFTKWPGSIPARHPTFGHCSSKHSD